MVAFMQLCQSLSNSHHDCFAQSKNSSCLSLNSKKLLVKRWVWHIFICWHVFWWSFNMQFSPKVEPSWYVKMTPKCALLTWKILFHLHYIGVTPFKNMAMSWVITLWVAHKNVKPSPSPWNSSDELPWLPTDFNQLIMVMGVISIQ